MTRNKLWLSIALAWMISIVGCQKKENNLVQYVNPLIGTGKSTAANVTDKTFGPESWGQVIPAVSTPFAMTQWTPQTNDSEHDGVAPYYYNGKKIQGFRGSHWLGGSCTQDYGSFTIMPMTGYLRTFASERASVFTHESETSSPAYYSCMLEAYTTFVEMTGTARSGFFRFSYLKNEQAIIWVTPNSDEGKGFLKIDPQRREIVGYNPVHHLDRKPGEPAGFCGYFVIRFNQDISNYGCSFQMENRKGQTEISGMPHIGAYAAFDLAANDVILAKVGTSFTGIEAARANLDAEIPHWEFDKTRAETERTWNKTLSVVELKGGQTEDYTRFYTAMYHSLLYPRTFSDVDGSYPGFDGHASTGKMEKGRVYYDDFMLEHTHKAQLPLVSLVAPERYEDMMKSLVMKAGQGGWLPQLPLRNSYSKETNGDPATLALGEAYLKGFDMDIDKAYPYLRKNAFETPQGEDCDRGKGRNEGKPSIENSLTAMTDSISEAASASQQASFSSQYALPDYVLSRVAKKYGKTQDANILAFRARTSLTGEPALQSIWLVDMESNALPVLKADSKEVRQKLDELFNSGTYRHSGEWGDRLPYLYNFAGDPVESQSKVKHILANDYTNYDGGIPGNDLGGQTSAWYVFSAMGFYPLSTASGQYQLSSPIFNEVKLNLNPKYYQGKGLKIVTDTKEASVTFNTVKLNDKEIDFVLTQQEIRAGGLLEFSNAKR